MERYIIAWTPKKENDFWRSGVFVTPHPDRTGITDEYGLTQGSCDAFFYKLPEKEQQQALVNLALMIVGDDVPIKEILKEFSKIDIWREMDYLLPNGHHHKAFLEGDYRFNPHIA